MLIITNLKTSTSLLFCNSESCNCNPPLCKQQGNLSQWLHTLAELCCVGSTGITQQVACIDPLRVAINKRDEYEIRNYMGPSVIKKTVFINMVWVGTDAM